MNPTITYECRTFDNEMPKLCKVLNIDNATFDTALLPDNKEEFENISDELILEHINNLIDYMKASALTLSVTPVLNEPLESWPLNGYGKIIEAGQLVDKWWWAAHTREEHEDESE